jgi:VWFA-related protein
MGVISKQSKYFESGLRFLLFAFIFLIQIPPANPFPKPDNRIVHQEEVSVALKLIQVYVSDENGNPVTDLKVEDFILYDNGKKQQITEFEKHIPLKNDLPYKNRPSDTIDSPKLNRKFFFLFDLARNDLRGVEASKKAAITFLRNQVLPTDEIAVLTYTYEKGLLLRRYLTTNYSEVSQIIDGIKVTPGFGLEGGFRTTKMPYTGVDLGPGYENLLIEVNLLKDRIIEKTAHFSESLKELSKSLRSVAGFKNIILFSSGISGALLNDLENPHTRQTYKEMIEELSSTGCPIFTVDTNVVKDESQASRGDNSLRQIAKLSGGQYHSNAEKAEDVAKEIHNSTSHYFVLGYYTDDLKDGKFHKIEIKVKKKGYLISAQNGYFNPKPFSEWSDFEKKLHFLSLVGLDNPHLITPALIPTTSYSLIGKESSGVLFVTEIFKDALPEFSANKVEIISLIFDENNTVVESTNGEIVLASIKFPRIYIYGIAYLPPGTYVYRLALRNSITGEGARGETDFIITTPPNKGIKLSTPFLFTLKDETFFLKFKNISDIENKANLKSDFSLKEILHFISNKTSPVILNLDVGISRLYGIFQCVIAGEREPEIEFDASLRNRDSGKVIQLDGYIKAIEKLEEKDILFMEFLLPSISPGDYDFLLTIEDTNNHVTEKTTKRIKFIQTDVLNLRSELFIF